MKINDTIIIQNRGKKEIGCIQRRWKRKGVIYYEVKTERGTVFESLTTDNQFPVYIDETLTKNIKKLDQ